LAGGGSRSPAVLIAAHAFLGVAAAFFGDFDFFGDLAFLGERGLAAFFALGFFTPAAFFGDLTFLGERGFLAAPPDFFLAGERVFFGVAAAGLKWDW